MSLLDEYKESFAFMDKYHTRDAEGNPVVMWTQSEATFQAALRFEDLYTIVTGREVDLEFNDVVKRLDDGTTFRVTTSGKDNKTPASAGLNMRAVSAKLWAIPDNEIEEPEVTANDESSGTV